MALVDKKETPKILYKLWKDDYVHMEVLHISSSFIYVHVAICLVFCCEVFNFVYQLQNHRLRLLILCRSHIEYHYEFMSFSGLRDEISSTCRNYH